MQIKLKDKEPTQQEESKIIIMWILTGFMLISGMVFMPSLASVTMILFSLLSAPVEQLQSFYASKNLRGGVKIILLIALFGASVALYQPR